MCRPNKLVRITWRTHQTGGKHTMQRHQLVPTIDQLGRVPRQVKTHCMTEHTSRFLPSDKTSRILFRLDGSLASSCTSTGCTCVPSITQPSVSSRICFLLGASLVVTMYSFVMPLDGCATSLAHPPVCHRVISRKSKEKTMPFGVSSMRSQVLDRATHECDVHPYCMQGSRGLLQAQDEHCSSVPKGQTPRWPDLRQLERHRPQKTSGRR